MTTRKTLFAFVTLLLLALILAGAGAWKAYAQGPGGHHSPHDGYGQGKYPQGGMMG